jgi:hypothetical protein
MSGHQTATIEDTVYFWFAANDTSGSGGDGTTPLYDVREAGAAAGAIPLLSGTPTLLSHANYPAGCYEVAIAATAANGFAADDTFAVFCTLAIDSQNPTGFVGSCTLTPLAKASALATAQTDLDTITGSDGVTLATAQGLYAPAKAGDAMTLTAAATSAQLVDDVWDEVINGANHNTTDTSGLRESGFYTDGFIYIDTVNGAADATDYEAGTEVNPTNSIANANTIATSLGLSKFKITPGSTITLAASQTNQEFIGEAWTLALGGQDISGSTFIGASVSGTGTNTAGTQFFKGCIVNSSNITVPTDTHFINCGLAGDVTAGEAGEYFFDQCHSAIAGAGSVTFDFGAALNASNLNVRHHSGGWTIANMGAGTGTYNASFEGNGQIVWAASCSATSNASIRGNWKITDNASGAVTETLDDNQTAVDAILVDTGTTLPATLGTPVADIATDIAGVQTDTTAIITDIDDVKGTAFVKDTHSLTNIEGYVDVLDDGTSGNVKIATDVAAVLVDTADMQPKLGTPAGASISADIATVDGNVDAIKTKTDSLTFSKANEVDANIKSVIDDTVQASSAKTTNWGGTP